MGKVLRYILNHKKFMLKVSLVIICVVTLIIFSAAQYLVTIDDGVYDAEKAGNVPAIVRSHLDETNLDGYLDDAIELKTKNSKSGGYTLVVDLGE